MCTIYSKVLFDGVGRCGCAKPRLIIYCAGHGEKNPCVDLLHDPKEIHMNGKCPTCEQEDFKEATRCVEEENNDNDGQPTTSN
jgi:hypothetical protein